MSDWFRKSSTKFLTETEKHEPVDPQSVQVDVEDDFPELSGLKVEDVPKLQLVKRAGKVRHKQPFLWDKKIKFHPSQIADLCPHEYAFMMNALHDHKHGSGEEKKAAKELVKKYVKASTSKFKPESHPKMDQGTAMHSMLQFYGGLINELVGQWQCPQCGYRTPEEKIVKMPTELYKSEFSGTTRVAKPCPECGGNINTHDWPWIYVEPKFHIPEYNLEGQADGLRLVDGYRGIVEFKTINDNGFKENYLILPKPEHVFQTTCYAFALKADFVNLIYISKDSMAEKEFIFLPDYKKVLAPAFAKIKAAMAAVEQETQPDGAWRACDSIKHQRAQKCPFAEKCFGQKHPINLLG